MLGVLVCVGTAAAAWLGWRAGATVQPAAAPVPPALKGGGIGPVRLEIPDSWTRTSVAKAGLPQLDVTRSIAYAVAPGVPASAVLTLGEVDHPSLIPAELRAALAGPLRRPAAAVLGGRRAWRYSGLEVRRGAEVLEGSATVVPSTAGTIVLTCIASQGWSGSCRPFEVRRLRVTRGRILPPADDLALRSGLRPILERLEAARARGRRELAARTRRGQARAANRLGAAYAQAASDVTPLVPGRGAGRDVAEAMTSAAAAYRSAGQAAAAGGPRRYAAAGQRARAAEAALAAALARLSEPPRT